MDRRQFLGRAAGFVAASQLLKGCAWPSWTMIPPWLPVKLVDTGQQMGHRLRDLRDMPQAQATRTVDTLILGSGVAGLTAAWRLKQQGHQNVLMLTGTEWMGNASAGRWSGVDYPRGAHYLPFPTLESSHVAEILRATGVLQGSALGRADRMMSGWWCMRQRNGCMQMAFGMQDSYRRCQMVQWRRSK